MTTKILKTSGVILGAFEADADGDAATAFQRASAIDARLAQHQAARTRVLRDPALDGRERRAALQQLADAEQRRLAEDAVFLAGARQRAASWRTELLAGPGDTPLQDMEHRRQFAALDEKRRAAVLDKALTRESPRDLPFLRALVADELMAEGLSGVLTPYRAPIEQLILQLADSDGLAAWEKTAAQLDAFAAARTLAERYVAAEPHLTDRERARRIANEAAVRGFVFNGGSD